VFSLEVRLQQQHETQKKQQEPTKKLEEEKKEQEPEEQKSREEPEANIDQTHHIEPVRAVFEVASVAASIQGVVDISLQLDTCSTKSVVYHRAITDLARRVVTVKLRKLKK